MGTPYKCECGWFDSTQDHCPKTLVIQGYGLKRFKFFKTQKRTQVAILLQPC